nr:hypothetical protein [Ureaplasma parvum]
MSFLASISSIIALNCCKYANDAFHSLMWKVGFLFFAESRICFYRSVACCSLNSNEFFVIHVLLLQAVATIVVWIIIIVNDNDENKIFYLFF